MCIAPKTETAIYLFLTLVPWHLLTAILLGCFKDARTSQSIRRIYRLRLAIPMLGMLGQAIPTIPINCSLVDFVKDDQAGILGDSHASASVIS